MLEEQRQKEGIGINVLEEEFDENMQEKNAGLEEEEPHWWMDSLNIFYW